MAKGNGWSMRARRLATYTVLASLIFGAVAALGLPKVLTDSIANLPEGIRELTPQVEAKPITIFDPPKYSIDEASSLWLVVNKHRQISPKKYRPASLSFPSFADSSQNPFGLKLRTEAAIAVSQMAIAMKEAGKGTLVLNSGFRSYKNQKGLYDRTLASRGFEVAEKLSARPGFSEHQTGLAADFSALGQGCSIMVCFGKTEAGIWLRKNAHRYGFILRYPANSSEITGFQYEPWHFRYVGKELALEMKTRGIKTLEQFWGLDPAPNYLSN